MTALRIVPLVLLTLSLGLREARADEYRILPASTSPGDERLKPLKDLDGYFPFVVPESPEAWQERADRVRQQLLVTLGLVPMPTAPPLNAVIHGRRNLGDYTVEKVYFQSLPGFFVTGNLYRPSTGSGRRPAVLCPHGHWANGRFYDQGLDGVKKEIAAGAEKFEEGGRSPLQARCVQLARMGCVVFHYDMLGYADSTQISYEVAHRFAQQRPEMIASTDWGLFSPQAEAHYQSVMGLQTLNSIRALDFLSQLPDVDPARLAVTGASGGGTQTFILAALDPRPVVAMPAVMVSTAMQGGCTCENASGLRINTGNVEIAALFAPKPLGLTAADDWTKEMTSKGFPELRQLYQLLGAPDHVQLTSLTQFGHNYNYVSRAAMYDWMNQHLELGVPTPVVEADYQRLTPEQLTVWDSEHPRPEGGPDFERELLAHLAEDCQSQLDQLSRGTPDQWQAYRQLVGEALSVVLGDGLPSAEQISWETLRKTDEGQHLAIGGLLRNATTGSENPVWFLYPKDWNGKVAIWLSPDGKRALWNDQGQMAPPVRRLLDAGVSVAGIDLLYQGEYLPEGQAKLPETPKVANPREAAAYTHGYNYSVFAHRVQDVLSLLTLVRSHERQAREVWLVGTAGAGHWASAARAVAGNAVDRSCVDTQGFRFVELSSIRSPDFLPGGAKYDDLIGMLAVAEPRPLWLAGEGGQAPSLLRRAYREAGGEERLVVPAASTATPDDAVSWLLTD